MSTREIVSLQFGHYSNFVGAHFWNIQELGFDYTGTKRAESNHDVLYREGASRDGRVTYTPRLLLADLKGSLKTLPETGGLLAPTLEEDQPWPLLEKIEKPAAPKNEYLQNIDAEPSILTQTVPVYNLEKDVKTWTDFLYPRFHHRTVNVIKEYTHGSEQQAFDTYPSGRAVWRSDYGDDFSDKIRLYVEECDSMQGFQVTLDATDGFAGLSLGCIEHLVDEYSKPIFAFPLIASHFPDNNPATQEDRDKANIKDSMRLANIALTYQELSEHSTMFVPMCTGKRGWRQPGDSRQFEGLNFNPELYYHSSAVLAAAIDTLSQKYRHRSNTFTLSDICVDMTGYGRKMVAASLGLPFLMNEEDYLIKHLDTLPKSPLTSITPSCSIATDKIFQMISVRGIKETRLKLPPTEKSKEAQEQMSMQAYRCSSVKEMMELYFQANCFLSATQVAVYEKPLKIQTPFPNIFSKKLNRYGYLMATEQQDAVEEAPVIAGLHNGSFVSDHLEKLYREVLRVKFAKLHSFSDEGLEAATFEDALHSLAEFKDKYDDDFEL